MRRALIAVWLAIAPNLLAPERVAAQDGGPLFKTSDLLWAGGFTLGTVALAPVDVRVAEAIQDSLLQQSPWLRPGATAFELLGFPGSVLITGGMYGLGRALDRPVLADMGLHTAEAIVLAEVVTFTIKSLAGRARPHVDVRNPSDFRFARGLRGDRYQSFPSGHTSAAFATAAAVTAEVARRWPDSELPVGLAIYSGATLVGVSRMYYNMHWATDVMAGAAIGTFAGWKVVGYTHANPDNRVDRWLLGVTLAPTGTGRAARFWVAPTH